MYDHFVDLGNNPKEKRAKALNVLIKAKEQEVQKRASGAKWVKKGTRAFVLTKQ